MSTIPTTSTCYHEQDQGIKRGRRDERESRRSRGRERSESKRSSKTLFQTGVDRLVGRYDQKDYEVTIVFQYENINNDFRSNHDMFINNKTHNHENDQENETPKAPPRRRRSRSQSLCNESLHEAPTRPPRSRSCSRKIIEPKDCARGSEPDKQTSQSREELSTPQLCHSLEPKSEGKPPLPTKMNINQKNLKGLEENPKHLKKSKSLSEFRSNNTDSCLLPTSLTNLATSKLYDDSDKTAVASTYPTAPPEILTYLGWRLQDKGWGEL